MRMKTMRQWIMAAAAVLVTAAAVNAPARAQDKRMMPVRPQGVLLFPATVNGTTDAAQIRDARTLVTDALRKYLTRAGVGVTVYSSRLPSIERAVRTDASVKKEDAESGPGDDELKAQRLAEVVGAVEFIVVNVEDYKFDSATRTATFNLSLVRRATSDRAPLGTAAQGAQGVAPIDVATSRQQGSAVARAAEFGAEQVVEALFPSPKIDPATMKKQDEGKTVNRKSDRGKRAVIFGGAAALLLLLAL